MSEDAFASYLDRWRVAEPQRAMAWVFLTNDQRIRFGALAALEDEWVKAIRAVREPQVAATKLGWWREEMQRAVQGEARHPLTQSLFVDVRVRTIPAKCWTTAVDAALHALASPTAADFDAQLATLRPLAIALADLESRVWFGGRCENGRAASVIACTQLLDRLRLLQAEVAAGRSPLPMNLLARHALATDELVKDSKALRAALRDQATALEHEMAGAATMPGPLSLFRAASLQRDLQSLRQAACADAPLAALQVPGRGFRNLLKTWQAARIWRAIPVTEATA